jgi:hypothetical protein
METDMTLIAANQQVSPGVYARTVQDNAGLPIEFMKVNASRIDRAYAAGEPIWMIVDELKMVYAIRPMHKPMKTPRALAKRVEFVR